MNIWLVMLAGGLITFAIRFVLIFLFGKFEIPPTLRRALHYVPPAVLSAIVFPELFLRGGRMALELGNTRLLAGIVAIVVAWFSKNTLLTIVAGMVALVVMQMMVG
jgi:branched-subunit amino acid transport protein